MSTKNGWFVVFSTSATVGFPVLVVDVPRLQETETATTVIKITTRQPRRHEDTKKTENLRTVFPFQHRIQQHGNDDHPADHDLLQKRRDPEQVEAVSEHAHDQRADERARECPI